MKTKEQLKLDYQNACDAYLIVFCDKHDLQYDHDSWVAGEVGTISCVSDYFVDMQTVITDIEMDAPDGEFEAWYDYCTELGTLGDLHTPNFKNWLLGCPRRTPEEIEELKAFKQEVNDAEQAFIDAMKRHNAGSTGF